MELNLHCTKHGSFKISSEELDSLEGGELCVLCDPKSVKFVSECIEKRGTKYDYSQTRYKRIHGKVKIICRTHGPFWQEANNHKNANANCPKCVKEESPVGRRKTKEQFIVAAVKKHGNKYDYSLSNYETCATDVEIICNKCKSHFWQTPNEHLSGGNGCPKCGDENRIKHGFKKMPKPLEVFIEEARQIHGDKFNYSLVDYGRSDEYVQIICNTCGSQFQQLPNAHLQGDGCKKCSQQGYSKISIQWLDLITKHKGIEIQHAQNIGEYSPNFNRKISFDGFCKELNMVFEFHGCYFHGCPICFSPEQENYCTKDSMSKLYNKTKCREDLIKNKGFRLITIWEHEFKALIKDGTDPEHSLKLSEYLRDLPLK
jgi:G:T-mismatch repair DNA endonuclease (very short patch repair protein)